MVKATIKTDIRAGQSLARCGRCGQALWRIQHNLPGGASELMETQTRGHRFDAATGTWSPTERYRAQYFATANRILVGREKAGDRDRMGLRKATTADAVRM
jgi:hypothetical protein